MPSRKLRGRAALIAVGIAGVALLWLDLHARDASPLARPLSAYARSPDAWLWHLAIGASAFAVITLAATQVREVKHALLASGVGLVGGGLWTTDPWFPWEHAPTPSGLLHVSCVALMVIAFAVVMGRDQLRSRPNRDRFVRRALWICYVLALAAGAGYLGTSSLLGHPMQLFGLVERILFWLVLAYCSVLAVAALRELGR